MTELVLIGHSMGGLVARSACHYGGLAKHEWRRRLSKVVFLGTPHLGAPLERGGNWVDVLLGATPYSAPLARLGKIRSAGITDLRFGNLLDDDWIGRDRFARGDDRRVPRSRCRKTSRALRSPRSTGRKAGKLSDRLIGDGMVPLASALGRHANPALSLRFDDARVWVAHGTNHLDLLSRRAVYARIKDWLAASG